MLRTLHLALLVVLSGLPAATHAATATARSCSDPAHRGFDFWIGDWDAYEVGAGASASPVARNRVEPVLDGCALHEDYLQRDGLHGRSFSSYDRIRKRWHQSWFTSRGDQLQLDGRLRDGRIELHGIEHTSDGPRRIRAVWYPQGDGVRETAEYSTDDGAHWSPWFDILFRPHRE